MPTDLDLLWLFFIRNNLMILKSQQCFITYANRVDPSRMIHRKSMHMITNTTGALLGLQWSTLVSGDLTAQDHKIEASLKSRALDWLK
jgi:hypothetical protein